MGAQRELDAGTPVSDALQGALTALAAAGCQTPRLDAEVLLAHALGVGRERLLIEPELIVAGPAVRAFQDAVRRRAGAREPVAYIVGQRDFRALALAVDRRVLVPRPETELLVELATGRLAPGASVLDVGTGSGAVALALKHERPDLEVAGSDISEQALQLARLNGQRLGLAVRWLATDLLRGVADEFDAIVSNPPYVREPDRAGLPPEVREHEPPGALFAGADGLSAIRALCAQVRGRRRVGLFALEVGDGQAGEVRELVAEAGFANVWSERDLAGVERVVAGRRDADGAGRAR